MNERKRKGFSDAPENRQSRLEFALAAIQWTPERLSQQMFSDEVQAHGGVNTRRSATVLVAGDRQDIIFDQFRPECLTPKLLRSQSSALSSKRILVIIIA